MALIPLTATVLLFFKKIYSLTTSPSFTYYQHILASSCSHCSLCWNCCQFTNDFYLTKLSEHCQSSQWVSDTTDHSFLASFLSWHLSLVSWRFLWLLFSISSKEHCFYTSPRNVQPQFRISSASFSTVNNLPGRLYTYICCWTPMVPWLQSTMYWPVSPKAP